MATAGYKARIYNGDFSLAAKLSNVSVGWTADMLDPTTFADNGAKRAIPGQDTSTFSCDGFIDAASQTDSVAWTTAQPFTYGHAGSAVGARVVMVNGLKSQFETGSQVAGLASFTLSGQTDGETNFGVSLHDESAETGTSNGTTVDQTTTSTTNGAVAHLHVTAFSGFTQVIYIIEDSADGSSWATIGTHATITAAGAERLEIAGTIRRYVRVSWTKTGTGSATFHSAFARRA